MVWLPLVEVEALDSLNTKSYTVEHRTLEHWTGRAASRPSWAIMKATQGAWQWKARPCRTRCIKKTLYRIKTELRKYWLAKGAETDDKTRLVLITFFSKTLGQNRQRTDSVLDTRLLLFEIDMFVREWPLKNQEQASSENVNCCGISSTWRCRDWL